MNVTENTHLASRKDFRRADLTGLAIGLDTACMDVDEDVDCIAFNFKPLVIALAPMLNMTFFSAPPPLPLTHMPPLSLQLV